MLDSASVVLVEQTANNLDFIPNLFFKVFLKTYTNYNIYKKKLTQILIG